MDLLVLHALNGLSAGLLLFLLSAGLTLVFSMLGVLSFAHAGFYMLGAYAAWALSGTLGFWPALLLAPLLVGGFGAAFEVAVLRRVQHAGHLPGLLVTFGLGLVIAEAVQLAWGRAPLDFDPPALLQGPALTLQAAADGGLRAWAGSAPDGACAGGLAGAGCVQFPRTRAFMMALALAALAAQWALLTRTRLGLLVQAALTHPATVQTLGHDLPRVATAVFGAGCGLAALAGVAGGVTFVTEPGMAAVMGPLVFVVVVVGGLGSLAGAFVASLGIGLLQTLPLAVDASLADGLRALGWAVGPATPGWPLWRITLAQAAPLLPYALLVGMLLLRPRGLLGTRDA